MGIHIIIRTKSHLLFQNLKKFGS